MLTTGNWFKAVMACAAAAVVAATASQSRAADPGKPVAGKQVRFPQGYWSALPQVGPDGKVRQCVLVPSDRAPGATEPSTPISP
jgi:hypothetical protein